MATGVDQAQKATGDCSEVQTFTATTEFGTTTQRWFYETFDLGQPMAVDVRLCGWDAAATTDPCPVGATCSGGPLSQADCSLSSGAEMDDGRVRVNCGFEQTYVAGDATTNFGGHWTSVEVEAR